jgi:hypothetical protein
MAVRKGAWGQPSMAIRRGSQSSPKCPGSGQPGAQMGEFYIACPDCHRRFKRATARGHTSDHLPLHYSPLRAA